MPANIIEYVDVNVVLTGAAAERFSFGTLMGIFSHTVNANRQSGPYSDMAEVVAAGFTSVAEPAGHAWATAAFAQDDGVDQILIGLQAAADAGDWVVTLDAIEAADPESWYITNVESRTDLDVLDVAEWHEARNKIYIAQSDGFGSGSVATDLEAAGYNRTALIYHDTDSEYLDGAWSSSGGGLNLDAPNGVGTWAYRQLDGVPFDSVASSEASEIFDANQNLFGRNKGLSFTSKGTMASGRYIDVQTTLDWTKARLEEAILSLFVGAGTKIPFTSGGINMIAAAVQAVYGRGVLFGHYSPDVKPTLTVPNIADVSSEDKAARTLTMTGNIVLAGAIHKAVININVQQ